MTRDDDYYHPQAWFFSDSFLPSSPFLVSQVPWWTSIWVMFKMEIQKAKDKMNTVLSHFGVIQRSTIFLSCVSISIVAQKYWQNHLQKKCMLFCIMLSFNVIIIMEHLVHYRYQTCNMMHNKAKMLPSHRTCRSARIMYKDWYKY